ncbi:hypothetical protein HYX08_03915 [Candidatus Woesearchaeota archaeon]|nr:hypothetical protein [Candidatus Woesearchaeota archaeon]
MEAKDLFLLMLIPALLMGLVVYTDANKITGAVAAGQKDSNLLGTYSINPSFRAKIDYGLDDYRKIKESFASISSCAKEKDIYLCLNEINDNDKSFAWSLNCDKGTEKVLYEFAEFFQDCIDSGSNNCICTKEFSLTKWQIEDYGLLNKNFELKFEEASFKKIKIESDAGTSQDIGTNGISIWSPARYVFHYNQYGTPNINLFFNDASGNYEGPGPVEKIVLYKGQNSIIFAKQENDNLKNPKDGLILDAGNKPVEISKLQSCSINPKSIYRLCAEKKDFKIMAYDKTDGMMKERPLVVKFAAYIPKKQ